MYENQAVYDLFLRNWKRGVAQDTHIDQAVAKNLITPEQAAIIKATPRDI